MRRDSFRQADIERLLRAARKERAVVQLDLKTMIATIIPTADDHQLPRVSTMYAPDGKENWEEDELDRELEEMDRRNAASAPRPQRRPAKRATTSKKAVSLAEDRAFDRLLDAASKNDAAKAQRRKDRK